MKKIFLSLLVALAFVSVSLTLVKADPATTVELIDGVQIRNDDNNGLRWVANVTNHNDSNIYGFVFAQGEVNNLTVETTGAINQVVNGLNKENAFSATMVKFPKSAAGQYISVRAYVKVGDTYTYSTNTVVRSLGQAALGVYGTENYGDFAQSVINVIESSYKTLYVGFDGAVNFGASKYEINPAVLEKEFIKDWNAKFGTEWTEFNFEVFNTSAIDGSTALKSDDDTDCSGTNAYEFFNTDPVTSKKWGWLLDFFLGETATGVHSNLQINAIKGNGTYEFDNNGTKVTKLWMLKHFSRSLHNFFSEGYENVHDYPGIAFPDSHAFAQIGKYNNQIIASNPKLVMIGKEVELSDLVNEGYNFEGYDYGSEKPSTTVKVPTESVTYAPQFAPVCYTIKYMYGDVLLSDLTQTYNIEDDFHLPESVFDGYDLLGWYDNPELNGDPIEMIEVGTTGDKVYYAKVEKTTHVDVNVTFDANGGAFAPTVVPGDFELSVEKVDKLGNPHTTLVPSSTGNSLLYNNKVLLNEDTTTGLYKVVAMSTANDKKTLTETAAGATWTYALANDELDITAGFKVGQYVYIDVDALATAPQVAKVYESLDSLTKLSTIYKKPATLPVPTNGSEVFFGWKSSVDGSVIKEYPGYMENPGDITYTAVWGIKSNVTFDNNGGYIYANRDALITDLIADFNTAKGVSYTLETFKDYKGTGYGLFAAPSGTKTAFANDSFRAKWGWLLLYLKSVRESSSLSVAAYDEIYSQGYSDKSAIDINAEFIGFITGTKFTAISGDVNYGVSSDYSIAANNWNGLCTFKYNCTITNASTLVSTLYKTNYEFVGWYDENGKLYDEVADFAGVSEVTLTAKFNRISHNITYQLNGGELPEGTATKYEQGDKFTLPIPTRQDYTFLGWSLTNGSTNYITEISESSTSDVTVYANWQISNLEGYVTFDYNGGSIYKTRDEMVADFLKDAMELSGVDTTPKHMHTTKGLNPGADGFTNLFGSDSIAKDTEKNITCIFTNATYAAKWAWLKSYIIAATDDTTIKSNLELNNENYWRYSLGAFLFKDYNDSWPKSENFSVESKYNGFWETLGAHKYTCLITEESVFNATLYKNGYEFVGWYDAEGNKYTTVEDLKDKSGITLTAKFKKKVVNSNITYVLNNGELAEGYATQYVEGEEFTLPVPTRQDYTFLGWSFTSGSSDYITAIPASKTGAVTVYANWIYSNINTGVTFNYNGGISETLIKTNGTKAGSLVVSNYGGNFWDLYASNTFVYIGSTNYNPQGAKRIYIAKNDSTGFYEILGVQTSGVSSKPTGTEYIITVSDSYDGTYDDNFDVSLLAKGDYVFFDKAFTGASSSNLVTFTFYKGTISSDYINQTINSNVKFDAPIKEGHQFTGWYDENGKKYVSYTDFGTLDSIVLTAKYTFDDTLIGSFKNNSWVVKGSDIILNAKFVSGSNVNIAWKSETASIATVSSTSTDGKTAEVHGLAEGLAKIIAYVPDTSISFTFYVTVVDEASGAWLVILESNNENIFIRENLGIGAGTPEYYTDIYGSVSQLLFTNYYENTTYYLASPTKTTTMSSVEFVTFHYAADMPQGGNAYKTGGKNLASYQQTASGVSYHYSTGMDGIYACANTKWGAWHAGSNKTLYWYDSGLTTSDIGTDVYTTDVTLKNGYFYIKGKQTSVKNSTGYSKLNKAGLAIKLSGTKWYIGGCYYNSSYGYISSQGGNGNSIGIESSVRKLSDLWLTWQYSAQLCAKLLIQFGLPIQRLVPHHFFSGKDCPQPLLANELEIWYIFVEMVEQEMAYFKANGSTKSSPTKGGTAPTFSESSSYIGAKGRVTSLPTYSTCQTYTVTYGGKTRTLSVIIPGTVA